MRSADLYTPESHTMVAVASCPDPELFVAFLGGEIGEDDAALLESHVDGCPSCCELLAVLARSPLAGARPSSGAAGSLGVTAPLSLLDRSFGDGLVEGAGRLPRGAIVGRYLVTEELGSGGMGVVYGAYDPELDRRVALKLLRARARSSPGAEARLLREARAIARLSHRNVVAVYDVGVVTDAPDEPATVFLAMELVEGVTLRRWIAQSPRRWREIVAVYLDAGRGLAAAHAAGIVHRDFKPGNVLVTPDVRVVVLDFGLARIVEELDRTELVASPDASRSRPTTVTRPHAVLGTPAYMAPEQRAGAVADARSDQWAFCLALAEALLGAHPILDRPDRALDRVIAGMRVPMPLRRVLARGLSESPADRFPDMPAVLEALEHALGRRRRRAIAATAIVVLGGITLASVASGRLVPTDVAPCTGATRRMADTWSPERREAIATAFAAVERPWSETTATTVATTLDAWAEQWVDEYTETCRATRVFGDQSEQVLDLRMACLDRARTGVDALVGAFERADAQVVDRALEAAEDLPPLASCRDATRLAAPSALPEDPDLRELVDRVHVELAQSQVRDRLGQDQAAREHLELALELARRTEHPSTLAKVLRTRGRLRMAAGELDAAETDLHEALWSAQDGRDDVGVAEAWSELVWLDGYHRMAFERARRDAGHANAAIERLGGDPRLEAVRLRNLGWTELRSGDPVTAVQHFEAALARLQDADAHEGRDALLLRNDLGSALAQLGRWDEAMAAFEHVRVATEAWLGPRHPEVAVALNNVGSAQRTRGRLADALATFERVVQIFTDAHGPDDLSVGRALLNLGTVQADMGRHDDALATFERAERILGQAGGPRHPDVARAIKGIAGVAYSRGDLERARERFAAALELERAELGDDHPSTAVTMTNLAAVLVDLGRPAEAVPVLRDALERMSERLGPDHPDVAYVHEALGTAHRELGELDLAAEHYQRAIAISEAAASPALAQTLLQLARVELARGREAAALPLLERSLALHDANPDRDPVFAAETRFTLGRLLWSAGERRRARQLVVTARSEIGDAPLVADLDAWLARHR